MAISWINLPAPGSTAQAFRLHGLMWYGPESVFL